MDEINEGAVRNSAATQWKKGQSGNPNGRPKDRLPEWLEDVIGIEAARRISEIHQCEVRHIDRIILGLNSEQLTLIAKSKSVPIYFQNLAMALLLDMRKGLTTTMDKIRDRVFGPEEQNISITVKKERSIEEIDREIERLRSSD